MTTEELRALFPEITDEEINSRQVAAEQAKERAAREQEKESQRQSLRDQIADLQSKLEAIDAPQEG